jgi:hypothetical protein
MQMTGDFNDFRYCCLSTACACNFSRLFYCFFCCYLCIVASLMHSQRCKFKSVVMSCMLTVPHENQWYGVRWPKQSMAN